MPKADDGFTANELAFSVEDKSGMVTPTPDSFVKYQPIGYDPGPMEKMANAIKSVSDKLAEIGVLEIPGLDASKITSGQFGGEKLPGVNEAVSAALNEDPFDQGGVVASGGWVKPHTGYIQGGIINSQVKHAGGPVVDTPLEPPTEFPAHKVISTCLPTAIVCECQHPDCTEWLGGPIAPHYEGRDFEPNGKGHLAAVDMKVHHETVTGHKQVLVYYRQKMKIPKQLGLKLNNDQEQFLKKLYSMEYAYPQKWIIGATEAELSEAFKKGVQGGAVVYDEPYEIMDVAGYQPKYCKHGNDVHNFCPQCHKEKNQYKKCIHNDLYGSCMACSVNNLCVHGDPKEKCADHTCWPVCPHGKSWSNHYGVKANCEVCAKIKAIKEKQHEKLLEQLMAKGHTPTKAKIKPKPYDALAQCVHGVDHNQLCKDCKDEAEASKLAFMEALNGKMGFKVSDEDIAATNTPSPNHKCCGHCSGDKHYPHSKGCSKPLTKAQADELFTAAKKPLPGKMPSWSLTPLYILGKYTKWSKTDIQKWWDKGYITVKQNTMADVDYKYKLTNEPAWIILGMPAGDMSTAHVYMTIDGMAKTAHLDDPYIAAKSSSLGWLDPKVWEGAQVAWDEPKKPQGGTCIKHGGTSKYSTNCKWCPTCIWCGMKQGQHQAGSFSCLVDKVGGKSKPETKDWSAEYKFCDGQAPCMTCGKPFKECMHGMSGVHVHGYEPMPVLPDVPVAKPKDTKGVCFNCGKDWGGHYGDWCWPNGKEGKKWNPNPNPLVSPDEISFKTWLMGDPTPTPTTEVGQYSVTVNVDVDPFAKLPKFNDECANCHKTFGKHKASPSNYCPDPTNDDDPFAPHKWLTTKFKEIT